MQPGLNLDYLTFRGELDVVSYMRECTGWYCMLRCSGNQVDLQVGMSYLLNFKVLQLILCGIPEINGVILLEQPSVSHQCDRLDF